MGNWQGRDRDRVGLARRMLAATLAWAVFAASSVPAFAHGRHTRQSLTGSALPAHERALQALNRLTFGPRPGDVARIEAMGVDTWINQQLYPETIDDTALEARLDSYPAMRLSQRDLLARYPAEPLIKAVADGKIPMPTDPVEHAVYSDRIYAYQQRVAEKAAADLTAPPLPAKSLQQVIDTVAHPQPLTSSQSSSPAAAPGIKPDRPVPVPARTTNSFLGSSVSSTGNAAGSTSSRAAAGAGSMGNATGQPDDAANSPSIKVKEQRLYADLAATSVVNLPPAQRVARIVAMEPVDFDAFQKSLTQPEKRSLIEDLTPQQRETLLALKNPQQLVGGELLASRLLRDVYSNRQLEAVMTDFWLNHFNVYLRKGQYAPWYLVDYEKNAIRPHALGKFEDLLVATAQSPAMLFYLDQQQSVGPHSEAGLRSQMQPVLNANPATPAKPKADVGLNENYARELMELHTLGVDGGYTQQDVTQVAEVFTGWGVKEPNQVAKNGAIGFEFNPRRHEPGPKYVLGKTIEAASQMTSQSGQPSMAGMNEGLEVLHLLAVSPTTAHHVSQQLAIRFVSDKPSAALVDSMAKTWVNTGGDIREVMRTMLDSPDFWSKDNYRAKIKTPEEFVVSALRATGGDVIRPVPSMDALNQLGMPFFGCQTPNGYPWTSNAWVNTGDLLDRINISISLANNKLGVATDFDALMASTIHQPVSTVQQIPAKQKESWLADALLSGPSTPQTQAAIMKQISVAPPAANQPAWQENAGRGAVPDGQKRWRAELPDSNAPILPPTDPEASTIAGLLLGSPEFQRK